MTAQQSDTIQQRHARKQKNKFLGIVLLVIAVNILAYFFFAQYDLTSDKRYTTTPATKSLLKNLKDDVEVTVFLTGEDMPAAFQRLSNSTAAVLNSFKTYSNKKVQFAFADPQSDDTNIYYTLTHFRMQGIPVTINAGKKGTEQKMIFPWVLVHNKKTNVALPVFLQEANTPQLSRTVLNKSEMLLEYNLANAIAQVSKTSKEKIGFLTGNGQVIDYPIMSALGALGAYYHLDTINLQQVASLPSDYDAFIINNPTAPFTEIDKFKIDQYLLQGGNMIMAINGASGTLDSFAQTGQYNTLPNDVNLSDLLFHYGVRLNTNLLSDGASFEQIPLSASGNVQESVMYPFVYYPVLKPSDQHPITKNLESILGRMTSSLDLVESDNNLTKKVLLSSSKYTKVEATPKPLALTDAIIDINPAEYPLSNIPVAVLLEGIFPTKFSKQLTPDVMAYMQQYNIQPIQQANKEGKLLLIADGDIFSNDMTSRGPLDLGEYKWGQFKYDNKPFLLNAVEYLSNPQNLLTARSKSFTNRILDPKRVQRERGTWQFINVVFPVISIIILGAIWFFVRKRKYGTK